MVLLIVFDKLSVQEASAKKCTTNDNKNNNENNSSNDDMAICTNQQHLKDRVNSAITAIEEGSTPFRLPVPFP